MPPDAEHDALVPAAATGLEVSVLGSLEARRDGVDLVLGGKRQQAVLARLAVVGGDVVSAERLVDDLWGDEAPASATGTLQSYVSNLRRILGPGRSPVIERVGDGYRLGADVQLTSVRFERLVAEATTPGRTPAERTALLEEALGLWHGAAVADHADATWAQGPVARLEELRLAAVEARFAARLDEGAHALVVGDLDTAVRDHPLRQQLTVQLVTALYRCGRQAEALRAYERTRHHLAEELGLDPGPDLVRLAARVAEHDPTLLAPELSTPAGASSSTAATAPGGTATGPVAVVDDRWDHPDQVRQLALPPAVAERRTRSGFVGRTRELADLDAVWGAVTTGGAGAQVVALAGEAGMGKTRLAQHLARRVHAEGAHVLWGRCAAEQLIAYQPVVEAVRTALRSISPTLVEHLAATRPALGPLLPDATGTDHGGGPRAERYEVFEALAELLGEVTEGAPVLLVVDDLQWADTATLSLLDHLVHHARTGRLLVLATLRRPAGRPTPDVDRFLTDLRRSHRLAVVDVDGFDDQEVAALLAAHGVEADARRAAAVQRRTGGNPFFVESLAETGPDLDVDDDHALPDSVRDVLDQRLAALDPEALRLLTAAAVIGLRVDLDVLAAAADTDSGSVLDLVDVAVGAGLLAEDEELGRVTFPHALVRQALVARLTRNREARLHLRVADAIEALGASDDRTTTVAEHLIAAGTACPPARAAAAAIAAGHDALAAIADEEARTWAERALTALARASDADPAVLQQRAEAHLLLARSARFLGQADVARLALGQLIALGRQHDHAIWLAEAAQEMALLAGGVGFTMSRLDPELQDLLAEALAGLGDEEPAVRAGLLAWSSIALNAGDQRGDQEQRSLDALDVMAQVPDQKHGRALCLFARRLAVGGPPGLDERLSLITPLREAATGWTELTVVSRVLAVDDLLEADRLPQAEAELEELRAFVARFRRPSLQAYVAFLDAQFALLHGRLDEAEAHSLKGYELGATAHGDNAATVWAGQLFLLARERGTLAELTDLVAQVAADQPLIRTWPIALAWCKAAGGDLAGASALARSLLVDGRIDIDRRSVLRYLTAGMACELAWATDDAELAEALVWELAPIAHRVGVGGLAAISIGHLLRHQGLVLATAGDLDAGEAQLALAVERSEACDIPTWRARALAERATVLDRRGAPGDADLAASLRAEAEAEAARLGIALALAP